MFEIQNKLIANNHFPAFFFQGGVAESGHEFLYEILILQDEVGVVF